MARGYVARRLLRRVVLKGRLLGLRKPFVGRVAEAVVGLSQGCDPDVEGNKAQLLEEISREEERFTATIAAGSLQPYLHSIFTYCTEQAPTAPTPREVPPMLRWVRNRYRFVLSVTRKPGRGTHQGCWCTCRGECAGEASEEGRGCGGHDAWRRCLPDVRHVRVPPRAHAGGGGRPRACSGRGGLPSCHGAAAHPLKGALPACFFSAVLDVRLLHTLFVFDSLHACCLPSLAPLLKSLYSHAVHLCLL